MDEADKDGSQLAVFESCIFRLTGKTADELRSKTIADLRQEFEEKHNGAPVRFVSQFPFIGRGNVLRDRLVAHEAIEAELDRVLER
jgi:hypothetical protein